MTGLRSGQGCSCAGCGCTSASANSRADSGDSVVSTVTDSRQGSRRPACRGRSSRRRRRRRASPHPRRNQVEGRFAAQLDQVAVCCGPRFRRQHSAGCARSRTHPAPPTRRGRATARPGEHLCVGALGPLRRVDPRLVVRGGGRRGIDAGELLADPVAAQQDQPEPVGESARRGLTLPVPGAPPTRTSVTAAARGGGARCAAECAGLGGVAGRPVPLAGRRPWRGRTLGRRA